MRNAASTSAPHLIPVLWDQVVVPELADEGERVLRAGQFCLLDVEKAQQLLGFQVVQLVHLQSVRTAQRTHSLPSCGIFTTALYDVEKCLLHCVRNHNIHHEVLLPVSDQSFSLWGGRLSQRFPRFLLL